MRASRSASLMSVIAAAFRESATCFAHFDHAYKHLRLCIIAVIRRRPLSKVGPLICATSVVGQTRHIERPLNTSGPPQSTDIIKPVRLVPIADSRILKGGSSSL